MGNVMQAPGIEASTYVGGNAQTPPFAAGYARGPMLVNARRVTLPRQGGPTAEPAKRLRIFDTVDRLRLFHSRWLRCSR
jgi:hypothetical protein